MVSDLLSRFAAGCAAGNFFDIPTWHQYIPKHADKYGNCIIDFNLVDPATKALQLDNLLLLGLGILNIMLRVASLVAVGFIMYAAVQYATAQGEPDKAKRALGTIINALVGLGITIVSAAVVSFIGARFT